MSNTNQQISLMIWFLNAVIFAGLVYFGYTLFLQKPRPTSAAYVPVVAELPEINAPPRWAGWEPAKQISDVARNPNSQVYIALHTADWHRRYAVPTPQERPKPPTTTPPPPPKVEQPEAENDLRQKLVIHMVATPNEALVSVVSRPTDRFRVVPVDSPYAKVFLSDLAQVGLTVTILEIKQDALRVRYVYKNHTFEFDFARKVDFADPFLSGGQQVGAEPLGAGLPSSLRPGSAATPPPATTGRNPRQPRQPQPEATPPPAVETVTESYEASPNVWVIAGKEVEHVGENMDSMIDELSPRSVFNRETRRYEGIQMGRVPESSLAYQRGFREGDTVISINGVAVSSVTEVRNYVRANKNLPEYVVRFSRRGEIMTRVFRIPENRD